MFKRIIAKNFLSWENLNFIVQPGCTLIEGINLDDGNSEGAGKSAIPNALCWALFGRLPKEAKIDDVIRKGTKSCEVTVFLNDSTWITRSRKPHDLYIQTKARQIRGKDARETQVLIEAHIGLSFETFCQAVYFAQNWPNKFLTAPEADRAKILADIQNTKVFDIARKKAQAQIKELDTQLIVAQSNLGHAKTQVDQIQGQWQDIKRLKDEVQMQHNVRLSEARAALRQVTASRKSLLSQAPLSNETDLTMASDRTANLISAAVEQRAILIASSNDINNRQRHYDSVLANRNAKELQVTAMHQELGDYQNAPTSQCPTCGSELHSGQSNQLIATTQQNLTLAVQELDNFNHELNDIHVPNTEDIQNSLMQVAAKLEKLNEQSTQIQAQQRAHTNQQMVLANLEVTENLHKQTLETLSTADQTQSYDDKIEELEECVQESIRAVSASEQKIKQIQVLRAKYHILKDGFKEVKSYVFRELLQELSRKANLHLTQLFEVPVQLRFHNEGDGGEVSKITTEVMINGESRPLGLFSGGQARRLQLSVDLALADIVAARGDKPIGLRILDEAMKDLSEPSMERVLHLLEGLPGSTIMIEHNSLFKNIVNNVFHVTFQDGVSVAVN